MNKRLIIPLSILILVIIGVTILILLTNNSPSLSPNKTSNLEECKTVYYNGNNKINIVFFSTEDQAKEYSDYFLAIEPFKSNKEEFNFYYIDDYSASCELYQDIAILCYNKELIKKASSCPNDYIVVIKEENSKIRSSAYMNVMSLNKNHKLSVFPHEFGHAFASLAEEYTPARIPEGSENCKGDCKLFTIKDGCFKGCSDSDYYRSIDSGIMRTLSSKEYGEYDEMLISEKIKKSSSITSLAIEELIDCTNEKYYLIEGTYSEGKINILKKTPEIGCVGGNGEGRFDYKLIMKDDSILTEGSFNPELIFTDQQEITSPQISGEILNSERSFILKLPIILNSKKLEIIQDNQLLETVDLATCDSVLTCANYNSQSMCESDFCNIINLETTINNCGYQDDQIKIDCTDKCSWRNNECTFIYNITQLN